MGTSCKITLICFEDVRLCDIISNIEGGSRAEWFRALDFNPVSPGSNPALAASWSVFPWTEFSSSSMLVYSQLVCLWPDEILSCYIQFITSFKIFVSIALIHTVEGDHFGVQSQLSNLNFF